MDLSEFASEFGLLLERKHLGRDPEEYDGLLPKELSHRKLHDIEEKFLVIILQQLFETTTDSSLLWALGKAPKGLVFEWYLNKVLPNIAELPKDAMWQTLIAIENFADEGITHKEAKVVRQYVQPLKTRPKYKELAMRILNTIEHS